MKNSILNQLLTEAFTEALMLNSKYVTACHLLLALLRKDSVRESLSFVSLDTNELIQKVENFLSYGEKRESLHNEQLEPSEELQKIIKKLDSNWFNGQMEDYSDEYVYLNYLNILCESKEVCLLLVEKFVDADFFNEPVRTIFKQFNIKNNPYKYKQNPNKKNEKSRSNNERVYNDDISNYKNKAPEDFELIKKFAVNLNELVEKGLIRKAYGREVETEMLIHCLGRLKKGNPLLLGEAGVGKTAIVEGLAYLIHSKEVPEFLSESVIFSLDVGGILAGSKLRGEFEMRLKGLVEEIKQIPNAIIYIDEIHTIVGAGTSISNENLDAANMLKPVLSSGEIRCIGSTTFQEYENSISKDSALKRRFQVINVDEPSKEATLEILKNSLDQYSNFYKLNFTEAALEACVNLAQRYMADKHFPDKAFDLLDLAGSYVRIKNSMAKSVDVSDVQKMVSILAKVPEIEVSTNDKQKIKNLYSDLSQLIFGQETAIRKIVDSIKLNRSGLGKSSGPIGSFLFVGPTGVGKTELVKKLSEMLSIKLIRFDMTEYNTEMGVTKLLGTSAGYIGYRDQGLLSKEILKYPYSVLLLDEIEKAHPSIFNLLLQIMDTGYATDSVGRKLNFNHCILVMTSNLGSEKLTNNIGFTNNNSAIDVIPEVNKFFTPEFRNRLDAIIPFAHLDEETILRVVDKFLLELTHQLKDKGVNIIFSDKVRKYIAKNGYDKLLGARPMYRYIEEHIRKPVADELLFGSLSEGGYVSVDLDEFDKYVFNFSSESFNKDELIF